MNVAPPRGERGLKRLWMAAKSQRKSRSPSWGAWIETGIVRQSRLPGLVAPPRGERGLKHTI